MSRTIEELKDNIKRLLDEGYKPTIVKRKNDIVAVEMKQQRPRGAFKIRYTWATFRQKTLQEMVDVILRWTKDKERQHDSRDTL